METNRNKHFYRISQRLWKQYTTAQEFYETETDTEWDHDTDGDCDWEHHLVVEAVESIVEHEISSAEDQAYEERKDRMWNDND